MKNMKMWIIPFVVLVLDFLTKILAINLLEYNYQIKIANNIYFYLTYNTTPFNSFLNNTGLSNNVFVIFGSVIYFLFGLSLLILPKYVHNKVIRVIFYILVEILCSILIYIIVMVLKFDVTLPSYFVSIIKFIGPLFVALILFIISKNIVYKILWGLYLGAGFGNFINLFYPPFSIIDFLYINNNYGMGIFNISDFIIIISIIIFMIFSIIFFIRFIIKSLANKFIKRRNLTTSST